MIGESALEEMGHTMQMKSVDGQRHRDWYNPNNKQYLSTSAYNNGLYFAHYKQVIRYFRGDPMVHREAGQNATKKSAKNTTDKKYEYQTQPRNIAVTKKHQVEQYVSIEDSDAIARANGDFPYVDSNAKPDKKEDRTKRGRARKARLRRKAQGEYNSKLNGPTDEKESQNRKERERRRQEKLSKQTAEKVESCQKLRDRCLAQQSQRRSEPSCGNYIELHTLDQ
jgi:hypothetical protein